jgi:hypothetical protein
MILGGTGEIEKHLGVDIMKIFMTISDFHSLVVKYDHVCRDFRAGGGNAGIRVELYMHFDIILCHHVMKIYKSDKHHIETHASEKANDQEIVNQMIRNKSG